MGGRLPLYRREGCLMTVFESLMLMLTFGTLIVMMLSFKVHVQKV